MIYKIAIYQPNSDRPAIQNFDTSFPLNTNSYDNFIEMICFIVVNEVKYKAVETTIFANENRYEQVLEPKVLHNNENNLHLKGWLIQGDLIDAEMVSLNGQVSDSIKIPILPKTSNDNIKIDKRTYKCVELIHALDKIQIIVGDSYSEDK